MLGHINIMEFVVLFLIIWNVFGVVFATEVLGKPENKKQKILFCLVDGVLATALVLFNEFIDYYNN